MNAVNTSKTERVGLRFAELWAFGLLALFLSACQPAPPDVPYAEEVMDFARLEHEMPLEEEHLEKITVRGLKAASQEQVDQIYARLPAGPIPHGLYDGDLFLSRGEDGTSRLGNVVNHALLEELTDLKVGKIELLGRFLWKGKHFDRETRILRNRIEDLDVIAEVLDIDRDQLMKVEEGRRDVWMMFPAKLYCGQSLLDGRRESIVIDYAFTDELPGYVERPDALAGRDYLEIRDEIRMVRPGFYLGRAYIRNAFALNFTLEAVDMALPEKDADEGRTDCWDGTRQALRSQ